MGVLFEYFPAATAISFPDGPGRPPQSDPSRHGWKLGRQVTAALPEYDTALPGGLDPVVQMGTLEAQLTGRDYDAITAGPRPGHMVASADSGQPLVIALTDELKDALATADDDQLRSAAGHWSQTEEFSGQGDPDILANALRKLAELARRANASNHRLYRWVRV